MDKERHTLQIGEDEWLSHRQVLTQAEFDQATALDKHILTLSSAALGLSALFLFNLPGGAVCWSIGFLILSWVSFIVAVISTLLSFITSQRGYTKRRAEWDAIYDTGSYDPACLEDNRYEICTRRLGRVGISSFVLGIVFFAVFAVGNLPRSGARRATDEQKTHQTSQKEAPSPKGGPTD